MCLFASRAFMGDNGVSSAAATRFQDVIKSISPDIGIAFRRFPDTVLIAVLFTAFIVLETEDWFDLPSSTMVKVSTALICAFLWSFSVHLAGEARHWLGITLVVPLIVGFSIVAGLFTFPDEVSFTPALFLPALLVLTGCAAYLTRAPANAAFWLFNHQLWFGAALALLGAVLFSGGLSIIVATLEFLFGLDIHSDWHKHIWTMGLGFIGPVTWLAFTPVTFTAEVDEGVQTEFTSRAIAMIVKFILVPLILVYTVILYAYAVTIFLDGTLPKGRLGPMVLAFGGVGSITALLSYPTRNSSGPLTAFFWRHWFWLNLGPILLLFLAAYQRISQYGVTEQRYLVVLAGIWLAVLAAYFALQKTGRDIRLLPVGLCVFLLVACVGPWGAKGFSIISQKAELAALLDVAGFLKDGKIHAKDRAKPGLLNSDKSRVLSIIRYLNKRQDLNSIAPWFAGQDPDPFANRDLNKYERLNAVSNALGLESPGGAVALGKYRHYAAGKPGPNTITGFSEIVGPLTLNAATKKKAYETKITIQGRGEFTIVLKNGRIEVRAPNEYPIQINIDDFAKKLLPKDQSKLRPFRELTPVLVRSDNSVGRAAFLIQSFNGRESDGKIRITNVRGWLLLAETSR